MSITIEEGKYYRTRDGQKVGPMVPGLGKAFNSPDSFSTWGWYQDGRVSIQGERPDDLVAEWPDDPPSPVVIETKKKIVPGEYGAVKVIDASDRGFVAIGRVVEIALLERPLNASELRAAARVFTDLADALEEQE